MTGWLPDAGERDSETGGSHSPPEETSILFRQERLLGFGVPEEEHAPATKAFFVIMGLVVLALRMSSAARVPTSKAVLNDWAMLGLLVLLLAQLAGDFCYRAARTFSASLRVSSQLVLLLAALVLVVARFYLDGGSGWALLAVAMCLVHFGFGLLVSCATGPRKPGDPVPV